MADTDNTLAEDSANEAKTVSSGADFFAPHAGERNEDVSGETVDGIGGAGLITDTSTPTVPATPTPPSGGPENLGSGGISSGTDDFDTATQSAKEVAGAVKDKATEVAGDVKDQAADALGSVKDQATDALAHGKEAAGQALEQGKQVASQALEQGKEAAGQAIGQAKDQIVTQLGTSKDTLAQTLEGAVTALHSTSQQFRDQNIPYVGEYAETFAGQVQKASEYLRGKDVAELARDAERVARENPIAFVAGAFFLGIALARFLKSSTEGSPLAFVQNDNSAPPASEALVPYTGGATTTSGYAMPELEDKDSRDVFGDKPITAHGYVPGGIAGSGS